LIWELSRRDFEKKYVKNFFGLFWAVADPLFFVLILYLVFGMRFGNKEALGVPFVVYLITGYIAYDFFNTALPALTESIYNNSFLIKKVDFRVASLPIVSLISNLMMHSIILVVAIVLIMFNDIFPSWYWLQVLYYIFCLSVFLIALSWFTSSVYLFFPDIKNIINIITRVTFFLTPLFWNMQGMPASYQFVLKLNPLFYIVNGYRDSLVYQIGFWQHPRLFIYFWGLSLAILALGIVVFKKLRPHFADVVA